MDVDQPDYQGENDPPQDTESCQDGQANVGLEEGSSSQSE
jgi:hypothetical protein